MMVAPNQSLQATNGNDAHRPMELINQFVVPLPPDHAWNVLNNIELVAMCIPGCRLLRSDGDIFECEMRIRVGPVTTHFQGTVAVLNRDEAQQHLMLHAEGQDIRGQGSVQARIAMHLNSTSPAQTEVNVCSVLTLTGVVAHLGQGVLDQVAASMMKQFSERLEEKLHETVTFGNESSTHDDPSNSKHLTTAHAASVASASHSNEKTRPFRVRVTSLLIMQVITHLRRVFRRLFRARQ